jgi:hypothetical protein
MIWWSKFEKFEKFRMEILKNSWKKLVMAVTLANCKLGSSNWYHFVRFGVLQMTWYSKFENDEIFWIKILKNSWQKSVMAITLAKYKLESSNWYYFVRIWVLQMIWYSKLENFENFWMKILKNSWKKLVMALTMANCKLGSSNWYHFVRFGVPQMPLYSKLWNCVISNYFF